MGVTSNPDNSDTPVVVGRRSARLSTIIPLTIRGTDASGQVFKENTWTISINKQGAKIATFHQLAEGSLISIENPVLGRTAKARVIRVGEKRFPEDPFEIGVELTEAQNVWGIKFPPQDWQATPTAGTVARLPEKAGGPLPAHPASSPPSSVTLNPPEAAKPGGRPVATPNNLRPENFNQLGLAVAGLSRFARQAEETGEARYEAPQPKGAEPAPASDPQAQDMLHETAKRLEAQLGNLTELMRNSRAELEGLLAKIQEVKRDWQSESESIQRKIQDAAGPALEELRRRMREGFEPASSGLIEDARKHLQEQLSSAIEAFNGVAGSRLASLSDEHLSKLIPQLEARESRLADEAGARISQLMQSGLAECREKLQNVASEMEATLRLRVEKSAEDSAAQILSRFAQSFEQHAQGAWQGVEQSLQTNLQRWHKEAQEEVEKTGAKVRELCQEQFERVTKALGEGIAKQTDSALNSVRLAQQEAVDKIQSALHGIDETAGTKAEEYRTQLAATSISALEGFERKAESLVSSFETQLKTRVQGFEDRAPKEVSERLQKIADEVLESLSKQLHKQADDTREMLSEQLKAKGKELAEETEKRLAAMTRATLESLTWEAQAHTEEYRTQLDKTLQEIQYKSGQSLEDFLRNVLENQREAFRQHLQKETQSAGELAADQIKSKYEQAAREASDAVYKQVGVGAVVLKDWADQASARLENSLQMSLVAFQKQIDDLAKDAREKYCKESEGLVTDLRTRLQQAVRVFEGKTPESVDPKLTQLLNDPLETK